MDQNFLAIRTMVRQNKLKTFPESLGNKQLSRRSRKSNFGDRFLAFLGTVAQKLCEQFMKLKNQQKRMEGNLLKTILCLKRNEMKWERTIQEPKTVTSLISRRRKRSWNWRADIFFSEMAGHVFFPVSLFRKLFPDALS